MAKIQHFDVVVVGGGSGLTAAYYALQDDRSVALITDRPEAMGGTCVNFGCIPTKTLIESAKTMDIIRGAGRFGIELDQASLRVDFAGIMADMRNARAENAAGARQWVERSMTPIDQRVHFVGDKLLETSTGERISGDKIFIATGARPTLPPIDGLAETGYWTNESVLELTEQPASLIIIGGGYIGAELGYFFAALGTEVTLVNPSARLLAEDEDVRELFTVEFGRRVQLVVGRALSVRGEAGDKTVEVRTENGNRALHAEQILLAAGRRPNSDSLELETTGVALHESGAIRVDDYLCTDHPDIYAYGDVIGQGMFKHTSSYEGRLAYDNAYGARETVSYAANPHAVFSDPEIGAVGLTERACREDGLNYATARVDYADVAKGKIIGAPAGFAKLLFEPDSKRILGCHIIGPHAAILIHEVVVAMRLPDTQIGRVADSIHIHPSLPEMLGSLFDQANHYR
jgi:dihydrolipoamide dehydrogenase